MTLTVTRTRTHLTITPANPFLACEGCGKRAEAFHDRECGCDVAGPMNLPCCCIAGYRDLCPSWDPVDGCQCQQHLVGHVPHPSVLAA